MIGMAEWRLSVRHDDGENEQEDNGEQKEDGEMEIVWGRALSVTSDEKTNLDSAFIHSHHITGARR